MSQIACIAEFDLTQRGDSWFYLTKILQTRVVSGQFVQEIRSFRSRTDDGHRPCKYIEELGGLLNRVKSTLLEQVEHLLEVTADVLDVRDRLLVRSEAVCKKKDMREMYVVLCNITVITHPLSINAKFANTN